MRTNFWIDDFYIKVRWLFGLSSGAETAELPDNFPAFEEWKDFADELGTSDTNLMNWCPPLDSDRRFEQNNSSLNRPPLEIVRKIARLYRFAPDDGEWDSWWKGRWSSFTPSENNEINRKIKAPADIFKQQYLAALKTLPFPERDRIQDEHSSTEKRFIAALAKSLRAVDEIYDRIGVRSEPGDLETRSQELFGICLRVSLDHALAVFARAHKACFEEGPNDLIAAKAIRCAVRAFVEVVFPDSLLKALRPRALADGVFIDLPAQTITGAEIVEAKLQGQPVQFVETMLRDMEGTIRAGRPRGSYAMPMPPTCGPDTLERFAQQVEEWLYHKLAYPGEKLTIEDIRRRLAVKKTSEGRRFYFVVNAPEWGLSERFRYNASWYQAYQVAFHKCIRDLNKHIPQIAFFALAKNIGARANEETTILQSVFNLLHVDETCP